MNAIIEEQLSKVLRHLYINPLEKCNLRCAICYTKKTDPILDQSTILTFIQKYKESQQLDTVTFCGGEVFTLPYFPEVINSLTEQGIFIQVITNGTVDRLSELEIPNAVNLIVSLDGLEEYHDSNRGKGNFDKSLRFLQQAVSRGFHTEIFSIVTKQNVPHIDEFEEFIRNHLNQNISVTYHPRKPPTYLLHHPVSNIVGTVKGFDFLNEQEMLELLKTRKTFPPKELGCFQIAVASDQKVYGCCEGITPLGTLSDTIDILVSQLRQRLISWEHMNQSAGCLGCSQPDFVCGIKTYLSQLSH